VTLTFVGFHCFGETDELSGSDEPYFINTVLALEDRDENGLATHTVSMTRIYDENGGVDAGRTQQDSVFMWQGRAQAISVSISLFENDQGDPNAFRGLVDQATDVVAEKATTAIAAIPAVGVPLAAIAKVAYDVAGPDLKDAINDALGSGDDVVATQAMAFSLKELLQRGLSAEVEGNQGRVELPLLEGDGATYKAYFDITVNAG